jgi:hypothetical protein
VLNDLAVGIEAEDVDTCGFLTVPKARSPSMAMRFTSQGMRPACLM